MRLAPKPMPTAQQKKPIYHRPSNDAAEKECPQCLGEERPLAHFWASCNIHLLALPGAQPARGDINLCALRSQAPVKGNMLAIFIGLSMRLRIGSIVLARADHGNLVNSYALKRRINFDTTCASLQVSDAWKLVITCIRGPVPAILRPASTSQRPKVIVVSGVVSHYIPTLFRQWLHKCFHWLKGHAVQISHDQKISRRIVLLDEI
mmetsp:Transcript_85767/g.135462  ORF Transcript_85767/g.135462 Transcript_85767/m.135462 type:complete len:206 (-) Transcript_85767:588-1205(-)